MTFEASADEKRKTRATTAFQALDFFMAEMQAGIGPFFMPEEFSRAEAESQTPLVFLHGYPGDLAADGDAIARIFPDAGVAFVDTGHTHYNELLNDGRVVYGATRSTGGITVCAKLFGQVDGAVTLQIDGGREIEMAYAADGALRSTETELSAGLHEATVACGGDRDTVRVLVREADNIPRRAPLAAPGHDAHAVWPWPEHGIPGARLGPDKNGRHW